MSQGPLWELFSQLRRRRFPLGPGDYEALRNALRLGFGWPSREELCGLCSALWAKSRRERELVTTLFAQLDWPGWRLPKPATPAPGPTSQEAGTAPPPGGTGPGEPREPDDTGEIPPP